MTLRILLFGKTGQVGADLARLLPRLGELAAVGRNEADLRNAGQLREIVRKVRPNVIVNAAAYTAVDEAEKDETEAFAINATAPGVMAEAAREIGAALVHYSTDYVFDGAKSGAYLENDATNPLNVYGNTKLKGEQAVRDSGAPHLIFRCSWIYATSGRNFPVSILRFATQREELRIVRDQTGAPTWSLAIATATTQTLETMTKAADFRGEFERVSGIYHMTAGGETTWFDFAQVILKEAASVAASTAWYQAVTKGRPIVVKQVMPITTSEYPTAARRPANSVLSNEKLHSTFQVRLPDWRAQLRSAFQAGS